MLKPFPNRLLAGGCGIDRLFVSFAASFKAVAVSEKRPNIFQMSTRLLASRYRRFKTHSATRPSTIRRIHAAAMPSIISHRKPGSFSTAAVVLVALVGIVIVVFSTASEVVAVLKMLESFVIIKIK